MSFAWLKKAIFTGKTSDKGQKYLNELPMKIIVEFGVLLACLISATCFAERNSDTPAIHRQERLVISPSLPDYFFEFDFDQDDRLGLTSEKPILVRRGKDSKVLQVLKSTDDGPYEWNSGMGVNAELDLNRDGYKDLSFGTGSGGQTSTDYFLFNPKTGLFDFQGNFPELYLEPKTNRIYSQIHISYRVYYKVINGRLTDTLMVEIGEETSEGTFEKITKVKKHGQWKVIKREIVKEPEF